MHGLFLALAALSPILSAPPLADETVGTGAVQAEGGAAPDRILGPVRVRALQGRVGLVGGAQVYWLQAGPRPGPTTDRTVEGSGYLELGARAVAEVRVPGRGHVRLEGPAALEWRAGAEGELIWDLVEARSLDLVWRRGSARLLVQGWRVDLGTAVLRLERGSDGVSTLHHRGGAWAGVRAPRRPRETGSSARGGAVTPGGLVRLAPGARVRIPRP